MKLKIILLICYINLTFCLFADSVYLKEWKSFSKTSASKQIIEFIKCNSIQELKGIDCNLPIPNAPSFYGQLGIFITIVNKRKVRGCYGAFNHKSKDLSYVLQEYLKGALKDDPRYPPL